MQKTKLVIFDLDGTLFRTETVDIDAFNGAFRQNGFAERTAEEILSMIGVPLEGICTGLLRTNDRHVINKIKSDVIKLEDILIEEKGELYPGVIDFLKRLKQAGFTLCICSNGNEEYVLKIAEKFRLPDYFGTIWFEKAGITKSNAVGILKEKYQADKFIMVGDRSSDINAATDNGGVSIGALYGFSVEEAGQADYKAENIAEVEEVIRSLDGESYF